MDSSQDVLSGNRHRRRRHTAEFKRELVERTFLPGASVAAIALEHQLNANLLHKWRRQFRVAVQPASAPAALLPVELTPGSSMPEEAAAPEGQIEIGCGRLRIRVSGRVDPEALRLVLAMLERA